jgi:hypothetical protein
MGIGFKELPQPVLNSLKLWQRLLKALFHGIIDVED